MVKLNKLIIMEKYIILLLGVVEERPIPSSTHLQKELFILSNANPKINEIIEFEKHYFGPYSADLDSISKDPIYHSEAFIQDSKNRFYLTEKGKEIYRDILNEIGDSDKIKQFLLMLQMIRKVYDKLTTDELLFIVYLTYPEYTEKSSKSKKLLSSPDKQILASKLFKKGVITQKKYQEIIGGN